MTIPSTDNLPPPMLDSIYEAALTITAELSLPIVLNRIVALARDLVKARYAALGIPDATGKHLVQFITSGLDEEQQSKIAVTPTGRGLLGELLQVDAKPIRLSRISDHPRSVGFPEHHPVMTSFLGVPIRSRGNLLGNLYLTDKLDAGEFSTQDQKMIEMLAGYAAVAIENARLYEQVQRLAVLEERERIGMDLHDGIIQSIYAVGLMLEHTGYLIDDNKIDAGKEKIGEAIDGLNMIIKDIRNYILDLQPQRFEGTVLLSSLKRLIGEFRANTLADVVLDYDYEIKEYLSERVAAVAFHIIQEALANAAKHAAATHVKVSVGVKGEQIVLKVNDNGRGFTLAETQERIGHGLSNMQLRAASVGGKLEINSDRGEGVTITAYLPLSGRPTAGD
ncbi:MAG: GAF domain-containing protein [Anaerolineae bacterium]|nr:GAF domain-containing protein [Anaerolineae bacterium]